MSADLRNLIALSLAMLALAVVIMALTAPQDVAPIDQSLAALLWREGGDAPANNLTLTTAAVPFRYARDAYVPSARSMIPEGAARPTFVLEP
jgi:hypothetical protein